MDHSLDHNLDHSLDHKIDHLEHSLDQLDHNQPPSVADMMSPMFPDHCRKVSK